jgi:hypothetical protein
MPSSTFLLKWLTLCVLLLAGNAMASPVPRYDTAALEVRTIPQDHVEAYKSQHAFDYRVQQPEEPTWWDRLKMWLYYKISQLFSDKAFGTGFKWTLWILSFLMIAYAVVRIVGMERISLFLSGRKATALAFSTGEEDIHAMAMDKEIATAEAAGDYRRAIRLQYLRSLKILSERGRIQWQPNKTNVDYLMELSGTELGMAFQRITRIFEYAWYGEMDIDDLIYTRTAPWFREFNKTVTG